MNIGFAIKTPPAEKLPGDLAREVLARVSAPFVYQSEAVNLANAVITLEERVQGLLDANNAEVESRRGIGHILGRLRLAVYGLYFAARWSPDRFCEADKLWAELRDAAGITPGSSTRHLGPTRPAEEIGWLIESPDKSGMGRPLYLQLASKPMGWGYIWATVADKALRFSRKVDAENYVKTYQSAFTELMGCRVVEHAWSGSAPAEVALCYAGEPIVASPVVAAEPDTGAAEPPVLRQRITTTWVLYSENTPKKPYIKIQGEVFSFAKGRVSSTDKIDEVMHFATKADAQKLLDLFGSPAVIAARPVEAVWSDGKWIGSRL